MNPVFTTSIGDARIQSILDNGFVRDYSVMTNIHTHSYYELFAAVDDTLTLEGADGAAWPIPHGAICLVPPGFFHRIRSGDKLAIQFHITRAESRPDPAELIFGSCKKILAELRTPLVLCDSGTLCALLLSIREEMTETRLCGKSYTSLLLGTFYVHLLRALTRELPQEIRPASRSDPAVSLRQLEIDEYFTAHYAESITAEDMARALHLSKRQLSRILAEIYRRSFREILIDTRLQQAAHLITSTDYPIDRIASIVGYNSSSGFYAAFLKKFGIPAGAYRRCFTVDSLSPLPISRHTDENLR